MTRTPACVGFDENVVLSVKSCFYDYDMRCILIKLVGARVVYHSRACKSLLRTEEEVESRVSRLCTNWFNSLSSTTKNEDLSNLTDTTLKINPDCDVTAADRCDDGGNVSVTPADRGPVLRFPCEFCSKTFRLKASLDKHNLRQHKNQKKCLRLSKKGQYSCDFCGLGFDKKPSMQRHIARKHPEAGKENIINQEQNVFPLNCDISGCETTVKSRLEYQTHIRQEHRLLRRGRKPKEPLDQALATRLGLDETLKDEQYDTPEPCMYCKRPVETRVKMYWHLKRIHLQNQKPCNLCGMLVSKLSDHMKRKHIQRELKKFVCEFCGESFKGKSGYQFHIAGHTGERKYSCRNCGKHYRTSSEAYNCERGHQGIYKWRCAQCSFKSHQRNKYVRHLRIHTKSQPYTCPLCEHRTARKDYLQKHIQKSHCTGSLTMEQVEHMYPRIYNIDEKIVVTAPISYSKLKLEPGGKTDHLPIVYPQVSRGGEDEGEGDRGHGVPEEGYYANSHSRGRSEEQEEEERMEKEYGNTELQGNLQYSALDLHLSGDKSYRIEERGRIDLRGAPSRLEYVNKNILDEFLPRVNSYQTVSTEHINQRHQAAEGQATEEQLQYRHLAAEGRVEEQLLHRHLAAEKIFISEEPQPKLIAADMQGTSEQLQRSLPAEHLHRSSESSQRYIPADHTQRQAREDYSQSRHVHPEHLQRHATSADHYSRHIDTDVVLRHTQTEQLQKPASSDYLPRSTSSAQRQGPGAQMQQRKSAPVHHDQRDFKPSERSLSDMEIQRPEIEIHRSGVEVHLPRMEAQMPRMEVQRVGVEVQRVGVEVQRDVEVQTPRIEVQRTGVEVQIPYAEVQIPRMEVQIPRMEENISRSLIPENCQRLPGSRGIQSFARSTRLEPVRAEEPRRDGEPGIQVAENLFYVKRDGSIVNYIPVHTSRDGESFVEMREVRYVKTDINI